MKRMEVDWDKWNQTVRRERWQQRIRDLKLFVYRFTCAHWWKAISEEFDSPYFVIRGGDPVCYQAEQCKKCGKTKIVRTNS